MNEALNGKTQSIKDVIENKNSLSQAILDSKKPMIIIGESFLDLEKSEYLFNSLKKFLYKNKKFTNEWNPLNILSTDASSVGNFDLDKYFIRL